MFQVFLDAVWCVREEKQAKNTSFTLSDFYISDSFFSVLSDDCETTPIIEFELGLRTMSGDKANLNLPQKILLFNLCYSQFSKKKRAAEM